MSAHRPALGALATCAIAALACGGPDEALLAEYRQARDAALAPAGPAPKNWTPDAVMQLSPDLVERLVASGVQQLEPKEWTLKAPGVTLTPKLHIDDVKLRTSKACPTCFAADITVKGPIRYDAGVLGKDKVPTTITASIDLKLTVGARKAGFPVAATVEDVRKVRVELAGLPKALTDAVEPRLTDMVQAQVQDLEPFEVAKPGSGALPLRALRAKPRGRGVDLELLTEAGTKATVVPGRQLGDWTLDVAEASLVRLAAREAFKAGPQDLGLVGELKGLTVRKSGEVALKVRVWRTEGAGWWRDLNVVADAVVKPRKLELKATSTEVEASSPGAALADPLTWIAESMILDEVEQAAVVALPTVEKAQVGKVKATVRLLGLANGDDSLRSFGSVTLE